MIDLAGKKFGSLTVIKLHGSDKYNRKDWWCRCDCGKEKSVASRHLVQGKTLTCGCGIGRDLPKPALGLKGDKHPRWKGGRYTNAYGYIMVYVGDGKYVQEHRLVVGLDDSSLVVHHKNHNKVDNNPENLEIMTRAEHAKEHKLGTEIRSGSQNN